MIRRVLTNSRSAVFDELYKNDPMPDDDSEASSLIPIRAICLAYFGISAT